MSTKLGNDFLEYAASGQESNQGHQEGEEERQERLIG